jgi:hypothetical protein
MSDAPAGLLGAAPSRHDTPRPYEDSMVRHNPDFARAVYILIWADARFSVPDLSVPGAPALGDALHEATLDKHNIELQLARYLSEEFHTFKTGKDAYVTAANTRGDAVKASKAKAAQEVAKAKNTFGTPPVGFVSSFGAAPTSGFGAPTPGFPKPFPKPAPVTMRKSPQSTAARQPVSPDPRIAARNLARSRSRSEARDNEAAASAERTIAEENLRTQRLVNDADELVATAKVSTARAASHAAESSATAAALEAENAKLTNELLQIQLRNAKKEESQPREGSSIEVLQAGSAAREATRIHERLTTLASMTERQWDPASIARHRRQAAIRKALADTAVSAFNPTPATQRDGTPLAVTALSVVSEAGFHATGLLNPVAILADEAARLNASLATAADPDTRAELTDKLTSCLLDLRVFTALELATVKCNPEDTVARNNARTLDAFHTPTTLIDLGAIKGNPMGAYIDTASTLAARIKVNKAGNSKKSHRTLLVPAGLNAMTATVVLPLAANSSNINLTQSQSYAAPPSDVSAAAGAPELLITACSPASAAHDVITHSSSATVGPPPPCSPPAYCPPPPYHTTLAVHAGVHQAAYHPSLPPVVAPAASLPVAAPPCPPSTVHSDVGHGTAVVHVSSPDTSLSASQLALLAPSPKFLKQSASNFAVSGFSTASPSPASALPSESASGALPLDSSASSVSAPLAPHSSASSDSAADAPAPLPDAPTCGYFLFSKQRWCHGAPHACGFCRNHIAPRYAAAMDKAANNEALSAFVPRHLLDTYTALAVGDRVLVSVIHTRTGAPSTGSGVITSAPPIGKITVSYDVLNGAAADESYDLPPPFYRIDTLVRQTPPSPVPQPPPATSSPAGPPHPAPAPSASSRRRPTQSGNRAATRVKQVPSNDVTAHVGAGIAQLYHSVVVNDTVRAECWPTHAGAVITADFRIVEPPHPATRATAFQMKHDGGNTRRRTTSSTPSAFPPNGYTLVFVRRGRASATDCTAAATRRVAANLPARPADATVAYVHAPAPPLPPAAHPPPDGATAAAAPAAHVAAERVVAEGVAEGAVVAGAAAVGAAHAAVADTHADTADELSSVGSVIQDDDDTPPAAGDAPIRSDKAALADVARGFQADQGGPPTLAALKGKALANIVLRVRSNWLSETGLSSGQRQRHRRMLRAAADLPPEDQELSLADALSRLCIRRYKTPKANGDPKMPGTLKTEMGTMMGALSRLEMYTTTPFSLDLAHSSTWRDALKGAQKLARRRKRVPFSLTPSLFRKAHALSPATEIQEQSLLTMGLSMAGRTGDIATLETKEVTLDINGDLNARFTYGKAATRKQTNPVVATRVSAPFLTPLRAYLASREGEQYLFGPPTGKWHKDFLARFLTFLRRAHPKLEAKSIRHGGVQFLCQQTDLTKRQIMAITGHSTESSLDNYAGMFVPESAPLRAAAAGLTGSA